MARFNLDDYQTVQERVNLFWIKYPEGRFALDIVSLDDKRVVIRAEVYLDKSDPNPTCVDFAEETIGSSQITQHSFVEVCSTSALGRAISQLGGEFSPSGKRPSREEMEKVERHTKKDYLALAQGVNDIESLRLLWAEAKAAGADKEILTKVEERGAEISGNRGEHRRSDGGAKGSSAKGKKE